VTRSLTSPRRRLLTFAVASTTLATAFATIGGATSPLYAATTTHASAVHIAKAAKGAKTVKVIVLLKNQHTTVPATAAHLAQRRALIKSDQSALLAELRVAGATALHSFTTLNGFSATMTAAQAAALATDARVASVVPDTTMAAVPLTADQIAKATGTMKSQQVKPATVPPAGSQNTALCGTATKPKLEPEALASTRDLTTDGSPNAQQLATGKGVTVAFIADGVDPNNPDFQRGGHSIVSYVDLTGTPGAPTGGAEAFGDASSIGAQGNTVYDISQYNNPAVSPVGPGCDIKIVGMAPGANIIGINSTLFTSNIVEGIDYAVTHGANVLNESFGGNSTPDSGSSDAIRLANDAAVAAGVTVTASTGDAGTTGTEGTPATDVNPGVISVGASTDSRIYQQTGYAAVKFSNGQWTDNNISSLSSGGVTEGGAVPDLVAPGEADWALCSTDTTQYEECASLFGGIDNGIQPFGGTSQSAPLTAGAAALVIQAYRDTHHGNSPTPALVKQLILSTTRDLGVPAFEQGAGLLDARAAVEAARSVGGPSWGPSPTAIGQNLLVSTNQLDLTGKPGTTKWEPVSVTNIGTGGQTVVAGSRVLAPQSEQTQTVTLNSAGDAADTPFTYVTGAAWVAHKVTFTVPAGADRLALRGAWQGAAKTVGGGTVTPVVRFTILDPSGTYVANSRPQGGPTSANYANLDIRRPVAGTWTAILYTVQGPTGYTGPVIVDTTTQVNVPGDTVSPIATSIPAGATRTVWARITVPDSGGDTTESITLSGSGGTTTSVPVVVRTLVELHHGAGSFTGTITGGNARAQAPTQTGAWAFDVPWGAPAVSVGVTLASDPDVLVEGMLVSPSGEVVDVGTNQQPAADGSLVTTNTLQATEASPTPGRYRFILVVENPVSGAEVSQDFSGTVSLEAFPFHSHGLPQHASITIKRHTTHALTVTVTNPTVAPISVQLDPRLTKTGAVALAPFGSATADLPEGFTPEYLIPPDSTSFTAAATSEPNAQLEIQNSFFAPDLLGSISGATSVATDSSPQVGRGLWLTDVQESLPPGGTAVDGTTTVIAAAQTQLFDTDMTSSTGDPWLLSTEEAPTGTNANGGTGVVIPPGQTRTISMTITPSAPKGTTVSGVLNVVTLNVNGPYLGVIPFFASSLLAAIPYKYTVS
jgi:hypothetical protein